MANLAQLMPGRRYAPRRHFGDRRDSALSRQAIMGIVRTLDRQRDLSVAAHVFVLEPAHYRIDPNMRPS